MPNSARPLVAHPAVLAGAILWGLIEWVALWRSRRRERKALSL
jgi:hypothetical protein